MNAIKAVPREEYDRSSAVNWSTLKLMGRSPAHYRHALLNPRRGDTDALKIGRAVHIAVYEPEQWNQRVIVWDGGRRFGKDWDKFREDYATYEILKPDEAEWVKAIATAVRTDPIAAPYVSDGFAEQTLEWTDPNFGIECKGRPDFIAKAGALVDLKTTRDASPEAFARASWEYEYHGQAAFYRDGYAAISGVVLPYLVIAVEKDPPHVVQVYEMPDVLLDAGCSLYRGHLTTLVECKRSIRWPGYGDGLPLELGAPRWADLPMPTEEGLAELGLEFEKPEAANGT